MAPVWTVLTEEPIKLLSDWWADALSRNYEFAREDFRKALYGVIKRRVETTTSRLVVSIHYEPNDILVDALEKAKIPWEKPSYCLPIGPTSCIELNGHTWIRHTPSGEAQDLLKPLVMSREEIAAKIFGLSPDALSEEQLEELEDQEDLQYNKSGPEIMRDAFDDLRKSETLIRELRCFIFKHLGEKALLEADPRIGMAEMEDVRVLIELEDPGYLARQKALEEAQDSECEDCPDCHCDCCLHTPGCQPWSGEPCEKQARTQAILDSGK